MRIAYFDCFSGISGDMILGAFFGLGLSRKELQGEFEKLNIPRFTLKTRRVKRQGITGILVDVSTADRKRRKLKEVLGILDRASLQEDTREKAKKIFLRLSALEGKLHGQGKDMYFHELGQIDSIVDVVGVIEGIKKLKIERIYCSPLHVGTGFVRSLHNTLPVPSPVTMELLKEVPVYGRDIEAELVTPTGAVLISSLAYKFGEMPLMRLDRVAYGAGKRNLAIPNLLRIALGTQVGSAQEDMVSLIETNIDDMSPEFFGYLMDEILRDGALDVWFTPVQMKKNRPAVILSALVDSKDVDDICDRIFKETTTLGLRISSLRRKKLDREEKLVKTKYGKINVKFSSSGDVLRNVSPSYGDCVRVARKLGLPLRTVHEEAKKASTSL